MERHTDLPPGEVTRVRLGPPSAFTLVELLVVVAIIGTLSALLAPALSEALLYAKITNAKHDLRQVQIALWNYYLNHRALPPTRKYCLSSKRHLDCCLPPELWESKYLEGPLYDVFNEGETYRYTAIGPFSFNDSPPSGVLRYYVPAAFPQAGGEITSYGQNDKAPIRCAIWSAGPGGPPVKVCYSLEGVRPENPAHWYPRRADGIICYYYDGSVWRYSY
jgi:prepilin-type N-terminal cleavage/methylation domain-containing protein